MATRDEMRSRGLTAGISLAASGLIALLVAAGAMTAPEQVGAGKAGAQKSVCGLGMGKKARGRPIRLGGIFTLAPGVDLTIVGKVAEAYFKCVNDNGGIRGRPITYRIYTEDLKPEQAAAHARKLVESDQVVGVAGSASLEECAVNRDYWKRTGYNVINAGYQDECFASPAYAAVNMGPRYSSIGATQGLVRAGARSIVVSSPSTIATYANGGPLKVASAAGIPGLSDAQTLPITDPNAVVLKLVQQAKLAARGGKGGVILNYTPDSAIPLLKAAEAQGLVNEVLWGSSTPIANEWTASQISKQWNRFNLCCINQEFDNLVTGEPDAVLYGQITKKYAPTIPLQALGQAGFLVGKFVTSALLSIDGVVDKKSYNRAVLQLRNQRSDLLCKPYYFWKLPYHIPNNADITVSYSNGKVVQVEKCFNIAAVDKELAQTRKWEKKFKLNPG
jgi:branched-chain amino acid transport system substrate-binding protein